MRAAISETDRRREIQLAYNERARHHGGDDRQGHLRHRGVPAGRVEGPARAQTPQSARGAGKEMPPHELERMVVELEEEMLAAAEDLRFEYAAQLRDELRELRRDLQEIRSEEAPRRARGGPAVPRSGDMA